MSQSSTPSCAVPTKSKYFGPPVSPVMGAPGRGRRRFSTSMPPVSSPRHTTGKHHPTRHVQCLSYHHQPHSIPDNSGCTCGTATNYYYNATRGQPSPSSSSRRDSRLLDGGGGDQARSLCLPPSRESTAWTVWPVGEGLPCASTRFGTRSPIFRKRWCLLLFVLYSCFHLLLRSEGRGCPLSQQMPPAPPLRVVMFPTIAIVIYNSLYILCILHESCLSYFIFRSHLSVRACRRLASVSWCCALRRDSAAFCMRR